MNEKLSDNFDAKAVTITTDGGNITFSDDKYAPIVNVRFKTDAPVRLTIPLARHIRTLVTIFGYDTIRKMISEYPEELKPEVSE